MNAVNPRLHAAAIPFLLLSIARIGSLAVPQSPAVAGGSTIGITFVQPAHAAPAVTIHHTPRAVLAATADMPERRAPRIVPVPVVHPRVVTPKALHPVAAPLQPKVTLHVPVTGYNLVAAPSIGVDRINIVLSAFGSPAAGLGKDLYTLGVKYGIDPAFALAFFVHESGCGTAGVAASTHSIGNIRVYGNEAAAGGGVDGFEYYDTWQDGMEDWYRLIRYTYVDAWGLSTPEQIIPRYAPSTENDTGAYISSIEFLVNEWRNA